mgnify:CR=1 FL=1
MKTLREMMDLVESANNEEYASMTRDQMIHEIMVHCREMGKVPPGVEYLNHIDLKSLYSELDIIRDERSQWANSDWSEELEEASPDSIKKVDELFRDK